MTKRRVRGDRSFRKLLRKLPDSAKEEMAVALDKAGDRLLSAMRSEVPRRTGALAGGLSKKLLRASLRLRVGFIGKPINRRLFYGRIIEFGRKAQTVRAKRSGTTYTMRIRARAGRPFVQSRRTDLRTSLNAELKGTWTRILQRAAAGDLSDA